MLLLIILSNCYVQDLSLAANKAKKELELDIKKQEISNKKVKNEGIKIENEKRLEKVKKDLDFLNDLKYPLLKERSNSRKDKFKKILDKNKLRKNIIDELMDRSISKNKIDKNKLENKFLEDIELTDKEREKTKTNNPVILNYSAKRKQYLELMKH